MQMIEQMRAHLVAIPSLAKFAIGLAVIVCVPKLSRRAHIPAVVVLLAVGILVGPHGISLLPKHAPVADFFADLGKLLLMFFAGLETNLVLFRKSKNRTIAFGLVTTTLPLVLGTIVGFVFGYKTVPAIVLGSLLASHTLLSNTIIIELGLNKFEPMVVTNGATVISDTLSLIVFAICVPTYEKGFSVSSLVIQLVEIIIFVPLIVFGVGRLGASVLHKVEDDETAYFLIMMLIVALAGLAADTINLPGIVGSFLAGLAANSATQEKPAKEKLEFIGNSLFIPAFFLVTGTLIDPSALVNTITHDGALAAGVIGALLLGKFIAAETTGRVFGYSSAARLTVWALTLPQVAATLAAALVAYETYNAEHERLIDTRLLNVVLVLMLSTSILGPVLTAIFGRRLKQEAHV